MAFAPLLLPALGTFFGSAGGIAAAGTAALGAVSAISEGNYQASVARNNARIAEANAARESMAGQTQAMRLSQENAGRVADVTASQSASGLSLGSRSFAQGRALETRIGAMEVQDTARAGAEQSQASLQQSANFRGEARAAKRSGMLDAAGGVLGLAGDFAKSEPGQSLVKKSPLKRRFS
jgi:hypothetical protein